MPVGKSVRSPRYTKSPRTPRSAHAKFYYTPSLIVHTPRLDSPIEPGCESTANLMENHSRSASPREAPRPQHRPPSPPTPPTVPSVPSVPSAPTAPSAFDNRAYQHDEADPNHNDSFTSNTPQNGHSKEPNGETKTPEAVNLELINLTPKNGKAKKKDVELDMNSANPYDEYFVSVNEHRKYMRGEKLYVTADKRGEKGGCKRPLCWTLLALVVAAVIALIVLAATGILTSSSPTAVENYNSSLSSARAFGGLTPSEHDHAHDHDHDHEHDHDHAYDHDHEAHDGHDHTDHASNEANVAQNDEEVPALEESNESAMYVPRTLEGQLRIDNEEYTQALSDPDSEEYHQFIATFGEELRRALFNRSMLEDTNNDINVQVIELRNGSVIVTYRVNWKPKFGLEGPKDLMTASSLKSSLEKYLATNGRMISIYHIAEDKMQASNVLDLCHINNNDCSHGCVFDEKSLDFICTCPRGQILDMQNPKKCISIFDYSDQIHNKETNKEVKGLEVSSNSETKESTPNPVSVNIAESEHTIDWKDNGPASDESTTETDNDTHFSHVFGNPEEPEPSSEPKSSDESEQKWEPNPTSEPEPTSEPKSEPELTAKSKADLETFSEPKPEPESTTEPEVEPEPSTESKVEPELPVESKSKPESTSEPKAESEPTAESKSEFEPAAEPNSEPELTAEPKAEPEPTAEPKAEPEPTAEPKAEPEPTAEPKAEPEPTAEPKAEPEPIAEPKAEPEPTPEPKAKPEPTVEPKPEFQPTDEAKAEPEFTTQAKSETSFEPNPEPQITVEPKPETEHEPTAKLKPTSEPATDFKPTSEQHQAGTPEPISKPEPKPNATTEPTPEAKSELDQKTQKQLAMKINLVPDLTAEHNTSTATAEPEPNFMPNLDGIMGVEPELVFLQDSEHTEDTETVMNPTANHTVMVIHHPLSQTDSERNTPSGNTHLERKPTDYFNILKHVDHEILETVDTTTTQESIIQEEIVENNSYTKDPSFFAIFQQDNEPVPDIKLNTTTNKNITEKSNIETTTMESSLDALHQQVYKNVMGEIPEKTRKIKDHILLKNISSTIKPADNQTTDENVDPLLILLGDKSMSESTTLHSKMPSNTTTKEDFILGPLVEATTIKVAKEPTDTVMKETSTTNDNILGPLIEATTVTVTKTTTEADKSPIYISPVTANSKISYILDDGTFFNSKDSKQTEAITGLEPITESFLTENENNTETQEVGANSEKKNSLQANLVTTENDMPEATEITFNMLLNRSSKAITNSDNSTQTLINVSSISPVNDTTTTESEWLSEPVTEISYEHLMNRMDNQLTTESSANAVAQIINGGQINDFEPDYLSHLSPTYAPEPNNELLYTAMSDYDSQEARVKRVNQEEKESKIVNDMKPEVNISRSSSRIDSVKEIINTSEIPKENKNDETTTMKYMEQNTNMNEPMNNSTVTTVNEYIYRTTEKQHSEPAPVWEEPDVERSTKEVLASINQEQKYFPTATTKLANDNNKTQENFSREVMSTQISNLNVTIYEKPLNQSQPFTTTKSPALHSSEYDEHEKETNPFLPEVENNNSLVKKLQEGHDLEPSNLNDTQNDNTNEQSTSVLDSIKSNNESFVNFTSFYQTIPAIATEEEDSFDDLLRESSREQKFNTTEAVINGGDKNINEDGLALSTFLLDTDDLDILTHKSTDTESSVESDFTTNPPEAEDEDYLSVVPASRIVKISEKELNKKKFKSENIEQINDIAVDFSHKKSDRRTFNELNTSK